MCIMHVYDRHALVSYSIYLALQLILVEFDMPDLMNNNFNKHKSYHTTCFFNFFVLYV